VGFAVPRRNRTLNLSHRRRLNGDGEALLLAISADDQVRRPSSAAILLQEVWAVKHLQHLLGSNAMCGDLIFVLIIERKILDHEVDTATSKSYIL
jgi:hypothetical protein